MTRTVQTNNAKKVHRAPPDVHRAPAPPNPLLGKRWKRRSRRGKRPRHTTRENNPERMEGGKPWGKHRYLNAGEPWPVPTRLAYAHKRERDAQKPRTRHQRREGGVEEMRGQGGKRRCSGGGRRKKRRDERWETTSQCWPSSRPQVSPSRLVTPSLLFPSLAGPPEPRWPSRASHSQASLALPSSPDLFQARPILIEPNLSLLNPLQASSSHSKPIQT